MYLGGPVAPNCTINKTKSSSSCLQLELVLFITFAKDVRPSGANPGESGIMCDQAALSLKIIADDIRCIIFPDVCTLIQAYRLHRYINLTSIGVAIEHAPLS